MPKKNVQNIHFHSSYHSRWEKSLKGKTDSSRFEIIKWSEPKRQKRRKRMSILKDGVFSSISYQGRGIFRFDHICDEHKKLLKSIKPRQRKKFENNGLVPRQLLQVLWDLDMLPSEKRPEEGMRIPGLLKFLREGKYRDEKNHARGILLHDKIDEEEFPSQNITYEMLIKDGRKFTLVSIQKEKPGTIFK